MRFEPKDGVWSYYFQNETAMKKKIPLLLVATILISVTSLFGLTSCDSDTVWSPVPPAGWSGAFADSRLTGTWQLVEANGRPVGGYDVNYLSFYGNSRGRYYYYNNGFRDSEEMAYWSQRSTNGASAWQLNLQYQYSSPTTVNYWFSNGGNYLWMQWGTGGGVVTYIYQLVAAPGW